ncbi:MAG: MBL fold metallo-hydrolase [Proteobacteria bacterium]|nr:MBL fold metallo-hydrolase [Pseudomonadota bacterium]
MQKKLHPLRCPTLAAAAALLATAASAQDARPADPATHSANAALLTTLPWSDRADFDDAHRGFIAALPDAAVPGSDPARPVWSMKRYGFLAAAEAPDTVNPSLWRQAQLNAIHGLFQVSDRVYQVRGMDLSNMTIIEGATGLILIDPLISTETAHAALDLYLANRPKRPVVAVIYSHSHVDHFGGVKGVVDEADVKAGKVQVIAPDGFMEHAVAENVLAGNAMSRRAQFMYGPLLPAGPRGQVDTGLGKNVSRGTISLIAPTDLVKKTLDTRNVDGVEIVFHLTPGTEAPSEMNMYFPALRVLDMAENTSHNMHNLYTLRGAEVRDGNAWSHYLSDAMEQFAARSDVLIGQHHWPTWGTERLTAYMARQRDLYKFINDQSLRLINRGKKPDEIAAELKLPKSLSDAWAVRGYYGTLSHNARAVYQKYMGFYDGNPANLEPLPPVDEAKKRVEYMGGAAAVIARARDDYAQGRYRWVASVLNDVVFADPANQEARRLEADALEQLGYQAEAGTWRNEYLYGALELRQGMTPLPAVSIPNDLVRALPMEMVFDSMGTRLDAGRADGKKIVLNWRFSDTGESYVLNLENCALTHVANRQDAHADATITLVRPAWDAVLLKETTLPQSVQLGRITIDGDRAKVAELFGLLDNATPQFEIVEPLKAP